jgi:hypothetical protein
MELLDRLNELNAHHRDRCTPYRAMVDHTFGPGPFNTIEALPFIHVSAFKEHELLSVPRSEVHRSMTSSGTSGRPSKVFIDKNDSLEQVKSLSATWTARFGPRRRQMFLFSSSSGTEGHNARWAALSGFSMFGKTVDPLDDQVPFVRDDGPVIVGMTTDVWTHRSRLKNFSSCRPIVLHGGGWKRLAASSVTREDFLAGLREVCPLVTIVNWFGMIEQVGTVYFDCAAGHFHEHEGASFVIRSPDTLEPTNRGLLQVLSTVPRSYPGHSLLTDDVCELVTNCSCGSPTKAFHFWERRNNAPARGCANV